MFFFKAKTQNRYKKPEPQKHTSSENVVSTLTDDEILLIQEKIRKKAFKKKAKALGWSID